MEENPEASYTSSNNIHCRNHVLPLGRRLAYSVGHVLNDVCASMWFTYLLTYQHSVLKFSNTTAGNLFLLGQIADAISTPTVGYESDRPNDLWLCKYGRRKVWHLVGTICVALSFPFIFMECIECSDSSQQAQFLYYGAFIVIFQFGWASTQVSHLSLIPDLTPISTERFELNALRYAMTVMSNIFAYSTLWLVLGLSNSSESHIGSQDVPVFRNVALTMVAVGSVFSIIFHIFVKENPHDNHEQRIINEASDLVEKPHLRWKDWFLQPQFYMIALLYMATRLYVNLSQAYMPLYIQDTLGLHKQKIAIIPLVIYISGFLSSFFIKFLSRVMGNKITYFFGCLLALGACVWLYFGEGQRYSTYEIYVVAVLIGVAGSTLLIISLAFTSDLISNSTTSCAFVFGAMSFVDKLSNGIALVTIQDLHPCISCCADCKWYYQYVLVFACGGAVGLSLVALAFLATQSVGERHNEDQLRRKSILRRNRRHNLNINQHDEDAKNLIENEENTIS